MKCEWIDFTCSGCLKTSTAQVLV